MAKKKKLKKDFRTVVLTLGILFSIILFVLKTILGSVDWVSVFAPVIFAFLFVFILSVLKNTIKKL